MTIYTEEWVAEHQAKHGRGRALPIEREKAPAKPEPRRGRMNKTETRYVMEVLEPQKRAGVILGYWFEALRFRIAKSTNYTGDFVVQTKSGWELHEVKGHKWEAGLVRFKTVTEKEPFSRMFKFRLCRYLQGEWIITEVGDGT